MANAANAIPVTTLTFDGTVAVVDLAAETVAITESAHTLVIHFDNLHGKSLIGAFLALAERRINVSALTAFETARVAYVAHLAQRYLNREGFILNAAAFTTPEELRAAR